MIESGDEDELDEPQFDLCADCRARLPPSPVYMSREAAEDFLSSCLVCSRRLRELYEVPPPIEA